MRDGKRKLLLKVDLNNITNNIRMKSVNHTKKKQRTSENIFEEAESTIRKSFLKRTLLLLVWS